MEQQPKQLLVIYRILEPLLGMVQGSFGETDRWQHCSRLAYQLADTLSTHDGRLAESVRDLAAVCALAPEPTQQDVDKAFEENVRKMLRQVQLLLDYERQQSVKQLGQAATAVAKAHLAGRSLAGHSRNLDFKGNAHEIRVFALAVSGRSSFVSDTDMLRCLFTAGAVTSIMTLAQNEYWLGELIAGCCKSSIDRDHRAFPLDSASIAGGMIELERRYRYPVCKPTETGNVQYAQAIVDGLLLVAKEGVIVNPIFSSKFNYL